MKNRGFFTHMKGTDMGKTYEEAREEIATNMRDLWMDRGVGVREIVGRVFDYAVRWAREHDSRACKPSADADRELLATIAQQKDADLRLEALRLAVAVISSGHTAKDDTVMDAADNFLAFLRGKK